MLIHDEFELPTKLGTILVRPIGVNAAHVHCSPGSSTRVLALRCTVGGELALSGNAVLNDGKWTPRIERGTFKTPAPWYWNRVVGGVKQPAEPSVTQIREARDAVFEALGRFYAERADAFYSAERARLEHELACRDAVVDSLNEKLTEAEAAREAADKDLANFNAMHPVGYKPVPWGELKGVRLLSSPAVNTPGILAYAKTAFQTGDAAVAIDMMMGGYDLNRTEAIALLSGELTATIKGDVVEFHSPYRTPDSLPEDTPMPRHALETKYGNLAIIVDGLRSCQVTSTPRTGDAKFVLTVRQVALLVEDCSLVFEADEWRTALDENGEPLKWKITRRDKSGNGGDAPTAPQARDVKYAVLEAVTAFHAEHPEFFAMAEEERSA